LTEQRASPIEVVQACLDAPGATDWDRLRQLFHSEARIGVFAGGGRPEDPETAIAAMQAAHEDVVYQASVATIRQLDEHAVLLQGRVRYVTASGGSPTSGDSGSTSSWTKYRSAVFRSGEEALVAYETQGLRLGA
jgi:hypothetical protein